MLHGILGSERMLLWGDKEMLHFAMKIDELEELLEQDDIFALFWVHRNIEKEDCAKFLLDLENNYIEAWGSYDETNSIAGIEKHFADGMQYVYCYSPAATCLSRCTAPSRSTLHGALFPPHLFKKGENKTTLLRFKEGILHSCRLPL